MSTNGAHRTGGGVGFLHLSENLRFTDNHGIETGGHAEQMPHSIFLAKFVKVRIEIVGIDVKVIMQESAKVGVAVGGVGNDLDAVAGGDHHALLRSLDRQ